VAALMLTITEATAAVPAGLVPITRFLDAEVLGQARTDKRDFIAADGSNAVTIELFVNSSAASAANDYPSLVNAACTGRTASTHPKIGTADQADEFGCPGGTFGIAFQQGAIECAVASARASVTEDLARAESAKIKRIAGA
jgi:hypothetical protein